MKIKLKIQQKIQFYILGASAVIYIAAIGYIGYNSRDRIYKNSIDLAECFAEKYAIKIEKELEVDMIIARTLAKVVEGYLDFPREEQQRFIAKAYFDVLQGNPEIDAIWDEWDLTIDSSNTGPDIRYSYMCWWENGEIKEAGKYFDYNSPAFLLKRGRCAETIAIPYFYLYPEEKDSVLLTDLSAPVLNNQGRYVTSIALDKRLTRFQEIVSKIKLFEGSYAVLFSNEGICIGHPISKMLGKNIKEIYPEQTRNGYILENIKEGIPYSFTSKLADGKSFYFTCKPVHIGRANTPWSLCILTPVKEINVIANKSMNISIIIGIIGMLFLIVIIWIISKSITVPLQKITDSLRGLAKGRIGNEMKLRVDTGDEIAEMGEAFNTSIDALNKKTGFADLIGNGNLDSEMELLGEDDILGKSLMEMRDSLRKAREEDQKRKEEDEKRRWASEGSAKFGDILRQNNNNLENLSYEIIKELVKYLNANQGGIFIVNDENKENKFLESKATFAYDRRKYKEKTIQLGEGLIGACAIEREKIYMTDIPEGYIEITSGLGDAGPTSLLLVPLKLESEVLGVIEIASFNKFTTHEIEFTERIAENIASTISSVRINAKTAELLAQSKQQAEELAAQEEEMRQNMEELQATQEEAARKRSEMESLVNALNSSSYVIEYDMNRRVTAINDAYLKIHGMKREEVIGLYHHDNMEFTEEQWKNYEKFWDDLKNGEVKKSRTVFVMNEEKHILLEVFNPIKDESGAVCKILKIANDITDFTNE